mgnify:CR=1 FL=1
MTMANRAAQFAPFAALTGHEEAIIETARQTSSRKILSPSEEMELSRRISFALDRIAEHPELTFYYFIPDSLKDGGVYVELTGCIKKFDDYNRKLILTDGSILELDNIQSIQGKLFDQLE